MLVPEQVWKLLRFREILEGGYAVCTQVLQEGWTRLYSQGAEDDNGAGSASRNPGGGGNGICRPDVVWIQYHGNILRMSRKASKINGFANRKGAYYTTITSFG